MDLLISQRQGLHKLRDEVEAIHIEVTKVHSMTNSLSPSITTQAISDEVSSPTPPRHLPDLNFPLGFDEEVQDGTPSHKN